MRRSMVTMLAVVTLVVSGCLMWATAELNGQQPGGGGGGGGPGSGAGGAKKGPMGPGAGQPGGAGFGGGGGFGGQPGGFGGNPFGPMAQSSPKPMTWEYRVLSRGSLTDLGQESLEAGLNKVGSEGWELVTIETGAKAGANHTFIFRRPGINKPRTDIKPAAEAAPKEKAEVKIEFRVYKMKHANAVEVGQMLTELMRSGKPDTLRIVADPNTNSLLLKGAAQVQVDVQMLLDHVDVPSEVAAPAPKPGKKGAFKK